VSRAQELEGGRRDNGASRNQLSIPADRLLPCIVRPLPPINRYTCIYICVPCTGARGRPARQRGAAAPSSAEQGALDDARAIRQPGHLPLHAAAQRALDRAAVRGYHDGALGDDPHAGTSHSISLPPSLSPSFACSLALGLALTLTSPLRDDLHAGI